MVYAKWTVRETNILLPFTVSVLKLGLRTRLVQDTIPQPFDLSDVRAFEKMRLAFAIELTPQ